MHLDGVEQRERLTVGTGSGNGNATVSFTAAANAGPARSGTLTIAGTTFTVNQAAAPTPVPNPAPAASTNVALALAGAVASASSTFSAAYPVTAVNDNVRVGAAWATAAAGPMQPRHLPRLGADHFNGAKTIDRVVVYSLQDKAGSRSSPPTR